MKSILAITSISVVMFFSGISATLYLKDISQNSDKLIQVYNEDWEKAEEKRRENEKNASLKLITKYTCLKGKDREVIEVKGNIHNTSSMATFKNITYKVEFYNEANTALASTVITLPHYITPGKSLKLQEKFLVSNSVKRVELTLLDAKAI